MEKNEHLSTRADKDLVDRVDESAGRYGMDRSKFLRKLTRCSLDIVERDGLDVLIELSEGGDEDEEGDEEIPAAAD